MSDRLQGNLPRKGESKTCGVPEPPPVPTSASRVGDRTSANTSGAASLFSLGGKQRVMLPGDSFTCQICQQKLSSRRNLHRHVRMHHQKVNICFVCSAMFPTHFELKTHIKTQNHSTSIFQCPSYNCTKEYRSLLQLQIHCDLTHANLCIRKCNCSIHNKFSPGYCFMCLKNSLWFCRPRPVKQNRAPKLFSHNQRLLSKNKLGSEISSKLESPALHSETSLTPPPQIHHPTLSLSPPPPQTPSPSNSPRSDPSAESTNSSETPLESSKKETAPAPKEESSTDDELELSTEIIFDLE